jgi:hypothetical protein
MHTLNIDQTATTPMIRFSDGKLLLWGTFVPVDPAEYCLVLHEWVKKYSTNPAPETVIDLGLTYTRGYAMNYLEKLLQELIGLNDDQHQVIINWYYAPNSISVRAGSHLSKKMIFLFNFVEVEEIR